MDKHKETREVSAGTELRLLYNKDGELVGYRKVGGSKCFNFSQQKSKKKNNPE